MAYTPPSHVIVCPFPSSDKPCELYCSPLGKESPLLVADRVLDGTPCGPYETDLCVHGRCQVTCFLPVLPVLGGALKRGLPLLREACRGAGVSGDRGEWVFLRRCQGCCLPQPGTPPAGHPGVEVAERGAAT